MRAGVAAVAVPPPRAQGVRCAVREEGRVGRGARGEAQLCARWVVQTFQQEVHTFLP